MTGSLNLSRASLVEVVDILCRLLKINYMIDPKVTGAVSLSTYGETRSMDARELLDLCWARVEEKNPALNAVIVSDIARARKAAAAADKRLKAGKSKGVFDGVPMTIKDSFETEGVTTAAGTTGLADNVPARDAAVVARLRRAGAILLGKTNVPEITLRFVTDNYVYGRTSNPYGLDFIPGGSSGGAAAIVAAGGNAARAGSRLVPKDYAPATEIVG